jgi:hypothetical protein
MVAFGSLALGLFVEAGLREGGGDDVKTFAVGVTVRSPFVLLGGGRRPPPTAR